MSVNKVILLGNVGNEPEAKSFDNGGENVRISLATTKKAMTLKDGKTIPERTDWHNVVIQGPLAKVVKEYVHKGNKLYIEGELRTRKYKKYETETYITEVYATQVELMQQQKEAQQPQQKYQTNYNEQPQQLSGDLPF